MKKAFRQANKIFQIVGGYFLALACFFGFALSYKDSEANLKTADKYTGVITDAKIISSSSNVSGKYKMNKNVFAFTLSGLREKLAIYNPKQDYSAYLNSLAIGDTITTYYKAKNIDELNLDVYQIEKNNAVVLELKDYSLRNKIGALIALIGGLVLTVLQTIKVKKMIK